MENTFKIKRGSVLLIKFFSIILSFNFINNSLFSPSLINIIDNIIDNNIDSNETDQIDNNTELNSLELLYKDVMEGIGEFINDNIYKNKDFKETPCYKVFKGINNETNQNNIKLMIQYSNLQLLTDASHEIECKRNNLTYFFISYKYKINSNSSIHKNDKKIMDFLNYGIFFTTGLCLVNECTDILLDNFNMKEKIWFGYKLKNDSTLFHFLNDTIDPKTFTLFKDNDENKNNEDNRFSKNNPIFLTIMIAFGLILLIRIFFSIYINVKLISINKKKLQLEAKNKRNNSDASKESQSEEFFVSKIEPEEQNQIEDSSSTEEKYNNFIDFISIIKNLSALGETKNYMYNNENLEIPYGFQGIALFFFALVNTFFNYAYYPSADYFDSKIFFKYSMSLLKFAQYSSYFYLSLNGFIYTFKFMNYYKKYIHNKTDKKMKYILLYFLTFIPKVIMFIITSFVFHFYSINILNSLTNYLYQNEFKLRLQPRECLNQIYYYIFFFNSYLQNDKSEGFIRSYNYIHAFVNEFYSSLFIIILFCLCLKVRSKLIDIIVILLIILNLICNFIFFYFRSEFTVNKTHYNFTAFLGEKLSIKYFHIYLNIFLYGSISGIIYFYKLDIISSDRVTRSSFGRNGSEGYFPFSFLDNISNYISNLSKFKRLFFIIINISILVLLCSVFPIENKIHENDQFIVLDYFLSFIHIYENHLSTIIFMIIVLLFSTMDTDSAVKNIFNSWPFIFISRIGYFFYSICETTILIFFIITNYQTYLNLSDLLFLNSGQFICGIFISTIFVILIEIPSRYYCKKLRKYIENKKNSNNYNNFKKDPLIKEEKTKLELRNMSNLSELNDNDDIINILC